MPGFDERARPERAGVPLAPGEELECEAHGRERAERADRTAQRLGRARRDARGADRAEQHRRDEVRAAALVLLGRGRRVDVALVARDGLVLGAVVAHELAVAQRHERRDDADHGRRDLAAEASAALHDGRERRAEERRGGHAAVLEREPGLRQAAPDHWQCREHLRHAHDAAHEGHAVGEARARPQAALDADAAVGRAHRRRPGGRPEQREAVAERHPAEAKLLVVRLLVVTHAVSAPILSMQCTNARTASSRSRTSMRSSGA